MISPRLGGLLLFTALFVALPLPLLGLDGSFVPAARFWQLGLVCVAIVVTEGAAGMVGLFAGLLLAHAIVFTTLLALACWLVVRIGLVRLPPLARDHVYVITTTLLLAIATYGAIYDTQFHHSSAHASLLELYF